MEASWPALKETSCDARSQSVSFLDAQSPRLSEAPSASLSFPACAQHDRSGGRPRRGWTSTGSRRGLLGQRRDLRVTHRHTLCWPGTAEERHNGDDMLYPPTSSSEVRADGTAVSIDNDSGAIQLTTSGMQAHSVFGN